MIFAGRLLQKNCREQYKYLYMAFIDLTKAFDKVTRELLWDVLGKFGFPPLFVSVLYKFHDGMMARVISDGLESESFEVIVGVKQGCVLFPVIFNFFLAAVTLLFRDGISVSDGIQFNYCLDGSLFNPCHLKAKSKVMTSSVFELQYALVSHTTAGLQQNLDALAATYCHAGLIVKTKSPASCQPFFVLGNKIN